MSALDQFVASDQVEKSRLIACLHHGLTEYVKRVPKDDCVARNSEVKRVFGLVKKYADGRSLTQDQLQELCVVCLFDPKPLPDLELVILKEFGVEVT